MLRMLFVSFAVMFTFVQVLADLGSLVAPDNLLGTDSTKLGIYFVATIFALANTFLFRTQKKQTIRAN